MSKEQTLDFTDYDDEALDQLRIDVLTEQERRASLETIPGQVADLATTYRDGGGDLETLRAAII